MEIPLHESFKDLPLIEYLAVLWPDISQRTLMSLFANGRVRSGGLR